METVNGHISFICFGGLDWWYQHRSHVDFQLTRKISKYGQALYVNSIVMQKFGIGHKTGFLKKLFRKSRSIFVGLKDTGVGFWVYSPFSMPVHHIPFAKNINDFLVRFQVWFTSKRLAIDNPLLMVVCPAACDIVLKMKYRKLIYLRTDVYELFPNVDKDVIRDYDRRLKKEADITLFVSQKLFDEEKGLCKTPFYLDHGVDYSLFASVNQAHIPDAIRDIPKPIVGFFGTLDSHTVDIELCASVADLLPNSSFVFLGKASELYSELAGKKNVFLLGAREYEEVPLYGCYFDVCIMPWRQTRWIAACNPIKLKEYLALGKPVVSTPFNELSKYLDVVYQARTPEEFAECIKRALREDNPQRVAARRKKVEAASWDSKVEQVLNALFAENGVS